MVRPRITGKRMVVLASVALLIVCIGLFVKAYHAAGPDGSSASADGATAGVPEPSGTALPTAGGPAKPDPSAVGATPPKRTISLAGPAGFTFVPPPSLRLELTVTSSEPIGRLGYLVPTSADHSSGDIKNVGKHWSLTTKVYGKPYYAAIFITAGPSGAAVTCTISIDGVVKDRQTTHGDYGRALCAA